MLSKTSVISEIAGNTGESRAAVERVLDALAELAASELQEGRVVSLPGIGRLEPVERKARMGRHPQTLEPMQIPAKTGIKFKPAKPLQDSLT